MHTASLAGVCKATAEPATLTHFSCDNKPPTSGLCDLPQRTALAAALRHWRQIAALLAALRRKGTQLRGSVTKRQARSALCRWRAMAHACRLLRRRYIGCPFPTWRARAAEKAGQRRLLKAAAQRLLANIVARGWQSWRAAVKVSCT